MEELINKIETIQTKEDFVSFLKLLRQDLLDNTNTWENNSLASNLEAAANWTEDMDGYYQNMKLPIPEHVDWKVFANILIAAKIYE